MSYQSQTKSNASSLGSLRCPFSRCQTVFSTPRAPHLTLIHTASPKQLSVHELSLNPLRKQLLFILPKNLSAGLSQDRQMLHFSPPNPFFNPGLNDTLSSFAFNHLFYLLTHVPLFFPFFFIVVKYTSYQIYYLNHLETYGSVVLNTFTMLCSHSHHRSPELSILQH